MQNRVEEYTLFHPDRGIEKSYNVSDNRDPLKYVEKINEDVCAFRFFNSKDGHSSMYLVGTRVSPRQVGGIALYAFGIDRDSKSVIATRNGCFFSPDNFPDSVTIEEYIDALKNNDYGNAAKFLARK